MQRSIATASLPSLRLLAAARTGITPPSRALCSARLGAGDPAVHAEDPQGEDAEEAAKSAAAEEEQQQRTTPAAGQGTAQPLANADTAVKFPPFASSPKLENADAVSPTVDPTFQQKRRCHAVRAGGLDDVDCVGWDGAPLRGGGEKRESGDEEREYKEYYAEHKPSPLPEVEFADTRKPITRATDGGAKDVASGDVGMGTVIRETVDDALLRAERMFREAAGRGDPDSPQARALARAMARMRGESGAGARAVSA